VGASPAGPTSARSLPTRRGRLRETTSAPHERYAIWVQEADGHVELWRLARPAGERAHTVLQLLASFGGQDTEQAAAAVFDVRHQAQRDELAALASYQARRVQAEQAQPQVEAASLARALRGHTLTAVGGHREVLVALLFEAR